MSYPTRALIGVGIAVTTACTDVDEREAPEGAAVAFRALPDCPLPEPGDEVGPGQAYYGGVVTTSEPLASQVGQQILAAGGNAVDAAVAVQFMLAVVEPQSSGLGGGGFMLIHRAKDPPEKTVVIDLRDTAPAKATLGMFDTSHSTDVKGSSGYAVGTPGAVHGMLYALERHGKLKDRSVVLAPAIARAESGFNISARLASDTGSSRLRLETTKTTLNKGYYAEARAVFRPNGSSLPAGYKLTQNDLASTLKAIAARGAAAFYQCGDPSGIALAIVETQTATRSNNSGGKGRMTCSDLAGYRLRVHDPYNASAEYRQALHAPLVGTYHGYTVVTAPPPSSGVFLLQMLDMFEALESKYKFTVGAGDYEFGEYRTLNVMQELMRAAFADRGKWLGDPDYSAVPTAGLLAGTYIQTRAGLITPGKRRSSYSAGSPSLTLGAQEAPQQPGKGKQGKAAVDEPEGVDTTHYTIIDADGNVVSVTSTVSDLWGSGLMVLDKGFMLNNQLLNFNDKPQGTTSKPAANDVQPGKRPRTTIAPTMLFLNGDLVAAYGSPGGTGILNALFQVTINLIDHRMMLKSAVQAPRLAIDSGSSTADTDAESGFSASVLSSLDKLGYDFDPISSIGAVQAIVTYPDGQQYGAADARRSGGVSGNGLE